MSFLDGNFNSESKTLENNKNAQVTANQNSRATALSDFSASTVNVGSDDVALAAIAAASQAQNEAAGFQRYALSAVESVASGQQQYTSGLKDIVDTSKSGNKELMQVVLWLGVGGIVFFGLPRVVSVFQGR